MTIRLNFCAKLFSGALMFKKGYLLLHSGMIFMAIGFWSMIAIAINVACMILSHNIVFYRLLPYQVQEFHFAPILICLSGFYLAFFCFIFIKCPSCRKLLLVVKNGNHVPKNKRKFIWFLGPIPPIVLCEHCGKEYKPGDR